MCFGPEEEEEEGRCWSSDWTCLLLFVVGGGEIECPHRFGQRRVVQLMAVPLSEKVSVWRRKHSV